MDKLRTLLRRYWKKKLRDWVLMLSGRCGGNRGNSQDFGRIAAQTAKQVIIQRIKEAERDLIYEEFVERRRDYYRYNF